MPAERRKPGRVILAHRRGERVPPDTVIRRYFETPITILKTSRPHCVRARGQAT